MPTRHPLVFAAALLCATACDPDKKTETPEPVEPLKIEQPFPTEDELTAIFAEYPTPPKPETQIPKDVGTWTMVGDVPQAIGDEPLANPDANQKVAAQVLAAAGLTPTGALMCYAKQYASFVGQHGGVPPRDIHDFMRARCGQASTEIVPIHLKFDAETSSQLVAGRDDETIRGAFKGLPEGTHVGMWAGTAANGEVHAVWARPIKTSTSVEPRAMSAAGSGEVHFRGELPWEPGWVIAYGTKGPRGAARCRPWEARGKTATSFAFACPVDPRDAMAMIEVVAAPPNALLGSVVAQVLVSPNGELPSTYDVPKLSLPIDDGDRSAEGRVAGINALRNEMKLRPLALSPKQSEAMNNMVPYLLADDRVVIGAMAGWRVDGVVRDADLSTQLFPTAWSVERELAGNLLYPRRRQQLFAPDAKVLAVGRMEVGEGTLTVDVTYELFEGDDFSAEEAAFVAELDFQRSLVGQPPIVRVAAPKDVAELDESARRIREHEATPAQELDRLGTHFAEATGRGFYTHVWFPLRIEGWRPEFPDQLFTTENVAAAVKISYFRPPGQAWGQHVVLMVYTLLDGAPK